MSGFPNMPQLAELRRALSDFAEEGKTIEEAQKRLRHDELIVDQAKQRQRQAGDKVKKLMESMDCHAPGNHGYENRMFALLTGLAQTAEQYGRNNP